MVRYLLHSDHCHILPVYMMRGGKFGGGWGLLVYPILLFYLPLSGSSPDMTVILLTGTLSLNSINRLTTKAQVSFQCSKTCVKGPLKKRQNKFLTKKIYTVHIVGAQWLSGRVLNSRPKGGGFEPHRRHCVVVLEQDTFILA